MRSQPRVQQERSSGQGGLTLPDLAGGSFVPVLLQVRHKGRASGADSIGIAGRTLRLLENIVRGKFHVD